MSASHELQEIIKTHNKILSLLLLHGPMMRIEIARWLGITTSAVTYRTTDLMKAGLAQEIGEVDAQTGPGRRSQLVDLVPEGAYAVGIHRTRTELEIGIVNLRGKLVAKRVMQTVPADFPDVETAMGNASEVIASMLMDLTIPMRKVIGIGIATVGATDSQQGTEFYYQIDQGHITPIPIRTAEALTRNIDVPITMAHKARAMACGERWFGWKYRNFLLLHVHQGVGSAVVLNGRVYNGQGHAGTIGHVKVMLDTPICSCGERGCVEALVNRRRLLEQINESTKVDDLYEAAILAREGNQAITEVFLKAAQAVALACAPIVEVLEPEALILTGPMFGLPQVIDHIKDYLDAHTFVGRLHRVEVLPSSFYRESSIIGAASLVFSSLWQSELAQDWPPATLQVN